MQLRCSPMKPGADLPVIPPEKLAAAAAMKEAGDRGDVEAFILAEAEFVKPTRPATLTLSEVRVPKLRSDEELRCLTEEEAGDIEDVISQRLREERQRSRRASDLARLPSPRRTRLKAFWAVLLQSSARHAGEVRLHWKRLVRRLGNAG